MEKRNLVISIIAIAIVLGITLSYVSFLYGRYQNSQKYGGIQAVPSLERSGDVPLEKEISREKTQEEQQEIPSPSFPEEQQKQSKGTEEQEQQQEQEQQILPPPPLQNESNANTSQKNVSEEEIPLFVPRQLAVNTLDTVFPRNKIPFDPVASIRKQGIFVDMFVPYLNKTITLSDLRFELIMDP